MHRFLLHDIDGKIRVMRFNRVAFGVNSSPFLLNATISHHLKKHENTENTHVVQDLKDNVYVDDFLTGEDSSQEVCHLIRESSAIMSSASFTLSKLKSNDPLVGTMLENEFANKTLTNESAIKVLGIKWISAVDSFAFDSIAIPDGLTVTKRVVLSFIARLFDPLGLVTPFVMTVKCLFQELWKFVVPWDEEVFDELR